MATESIKGNDAIVKAALLAGCKSFYGYPITPASEIAHAAAKYFPRVGRTTPTFASRTSDADDTELDASSTDDGVAEGDATSTDGEVAKGDASSTDSGPIEVIGSFTVLSLGSRLERNEVARANRMPQSMQTTMLIRVKFNESGTAMADPRAEKLLARLAVTNTQHVRIQWHPRKTAAP